MTHSTTRFVRYLMQCGLLPILFIAVSQALCWAGPATQAGPYHVEVVTDPSVIALGQGKLLIKITDAAGKPVEGAQVRALTKMPGMNMGERPQPGLPQSGQPGVYEARATYAMEGGYTSAIQIRGPQGSATATIPLQTGQNTVGATAAPRGSPWSWLPWLGGAFVLTFVFYRVWRTGQRPNWRALLNRQVVGGLALLAVMLAVATYAVGHWRRPDSYTPIEAQAMDMNLPAPPGYVPVRLATVQGGPVTSSVTYAGQAVGYVEQEVYPRVAGNLLWMPFYAGDRVRRGQLLARLDTSQVTPQVAEREAAVRQAEQATAVSRAAYQQAAGAVGQAHAEVGGKMGALSEAHSQRAKAQAELGTRRGAVLEAQQLLRRARATAATRQAAVAEAHSQERQARAAVDEAQSGLDAATHAVDEARSDLTAAQEERNGADADVAAAQTQVADANAQLTAARADLQYWTDEIKRMRTLLDQRAVSRDEFQREQAQAAGAAAKVRQAEARVSQMEAGVSSAQSRGRKAAAMIAAANAKARQAQAAISGGQAKVAQAREAVTASQARVAQMTADAQGAEADIGAATARVQQMAGDVRATQADIGAAGARVQEAESELQAHHAHVRQMEAALGGAQSQIGQAEAGVAQAQAALTSATTARGYTEIRALTDGVVTQRLISPGVLVAPGQAILKVVQVNPIRLQANVAEVDLKRVRVGSPVTITSQSDATKTMPARVTSVAPAVDPTSRTGIVEAMVPNTNNWFLPGQYVSMTIGLGQSLVAPRVPNAAIQYRAVPSGDVISTDTTPFVWVADPAGDTGQFTVHLVNVRLGAGNGSQTAVLSGLQQGQRIVVAGYQYLKNGDMVAPADAGADEDAGATAAAPVTARATATQTASIAVTENGYVPANLTLKAGVPARITVTRKTDQTCGTEIVFPDYRIKQSLPLNKPVVITLTPRRAGSFLFTCGMGMLHGKVMVQ